MKVGANNIVGLRSNFERTTNALTRALERLSTGKRAPNFGDDPALNSMGTRLDSQVRGLKQSVLNSNEALQASESASSAIDVQLELVQRMREIALDASSSTKSQSERENLQNEIRQLLGEFERVNKSASYNGADLLKGAKFNFGMAFQSPDTSLTASFKQNVGTGSFTRSSTLATVAVYDVHFANLNGDAFQDLVESNGNVRLGGANGSFGPVKTNYLAVDADDFKFADVTGDGILDFIYGARTLTQIGVGAGDGTFNFNTTLHPSLGGTVSTGDIDHDGDLDIVSLTGTGGDGIGIYLNNGSGAFTFSATYKAYDTGGYADSNAYKIDLVDINADGNLDLIYNSGIDNGIFNEAVIYRLGTGTGSFAAPITLAHSDGADYSVADINNDGRVEVITSTITNSNVWSLTNGGTFSAGANFSGTSGGGHEMQIVDLNNDGLKDIFYGAGYVSMNLGSGKFSGGALLGGASSGDYFDVADMNSDGVLDIVSSTGSGTLSLWNQQTRSRSVLEKISVESADKAVELVSILDTTLANLQKSSSTYTALHSRLDVRSTSEALLTDALSDAVDQMSQADIVLETAEVVRQQILQNAQVAVMAQANSSVSMLLSLMKSLM